MRIIRVYKSIGLCYAPVNMQNDLVERLRCAGSRVTPARVTVLRFLQQQTVPVSVDDIAQHLPEISAATLYRMMADFVSRGLVEAHELGHGHLDYELADRPHHHHLVCEHCGIVEDVFPCKTSCRLEQLVLSASRSFRTLDRQIATFFGRCKRCATPTSSTSS